MKRAIVNILIVICVGVMAYSGYRIYTSKQAYKVGDDTYRELNQYIDHENKAENGSETGESEAAKKRVEVIMSDEGETWDIDLPDVDFDSLREKNPDTVGWIYIEDTHIDYPVVQGKDNDYYLHRLFTGGTAISGSIFLDSECPSDFTGFNSILYGHHMRNGSMFHDLEFFKEQEFYENHPYAILMTPEHAYVIQLFAGFVSKTSMDSWKVDFETDQEKQSWLTWLMSKSNFERKLTPTINDRILTLSTCSYEFNNARYVVYGILTEVR